MSFDQTQVADPIGFPTVEAPPARAPRLTGVGFAFCAFVVASFAYEIPLVYITDFYKGNPYLFDVAGILLILYWLLFGRNHGWGITLHKNPLFAPWLAVTLAYLFATMMCVTWIPFKHWVYAVFYALKYVEGIAVLFILLSAPFDERRKRQLLWVALLGGVWVAFYAVLQLLEIAPTSRTIPKGWDITLEGTGIFSTLGTTYFHTGQFGVLSGLVGVALFRASRGPARILAGLMAAFSIIPSIVSGSRAGFLALIVSLGVLVMQPQYRRHFPTYLIAVLIGASINYWYSESLTATRNVGGRATSIASRLQAGPKTLRMGLEEHGPRLILAGGGFMTMPLNGRWRHHYGVHNIFLFPLEQAGIFAFFAAMWLFARLGANLWRAPPGAAATQLDGSLRASMFAYWVALMVVGWGGQVFWLGFGTEHLTFFQVTLFGLGMTRTATSGQTSPAAGADPNQSALSDWAWGDSVDVPSR